MANTKVTGNLIASSTIATDNIADNAVTSDKISGITTAHIAEGTNLYYTDARADARAALLVDSAPSTLNTLNELAAALGDDPNFATTVTNSIGTKLPLAGGTLTGGLTGTTAGFSGSITASGNSNSFGNTTIGALAASTGTFSASVTAAGNSNSFGNSTFAGNVTVNARGFFNSGGSYPLATSSTQRYNIQIRNTNNTVNSGYGWWWGTDTNFNMFFHADGASDRMTLTRLGELGVNWTSPGGYGQLTVNGSSALPILALRSTSGKVRQGFYEGGTGRFYFDTLGDDGLAFIDGDGLSTRMLIDSAGKVGINKTDPAFKTHIRGGSGTEETVLKIDKSSAADSGGHMTIVGLGCESAGWAKAGIGFERTGAYDTGKMHFLMYPTGLNTNTVGLSNSVMTINNDGNVGIATASPGQKLQVNGSIKIANSNSRLVFGTSGGTDRRALEGNTSGSLLQIGEGYTDIALQGDVGIGTTTPNATLHVNGGVHFGTDSAVLNPTNGQVLIETVAGGTPRLQMYVYGSSVFDISSDGTTGNIGWSSGASREVNFQNTGAGGIKVGIATGAPTQPLDVNGYSICDKQFQRDNTLQTILNTPRVLSIGYQGANGTYTFNPVTLFGSLPQGGQCEIQVSGWQNKINNGFIYWRDNGSNTSIGNGVVAFVQTAVVGSGAISVSTNGATNNITIQFTGWHSNAHGWSCKIISYQA